MYMLALLQTSQKYQLSFDTKFLSVALVVPEIITIVCRYVVLHKITDFLPKIAHKTKKNIFQPDNHSKISPVGPF